MPTPNRGNGGNVPIRTRLSLTAKKLVKDMLTEMTSDPDLSTEDEDDLGGDDNHQHIHIHMNGEGGGKAAPAPGATDDDGAGGGGGGGGADMESRMTACEKGIAEILAIVKGTQGGTGDGDPPPAKKDGEGDPPPAAKTDDEDPDAPPADKDDKSATMDSAALETSFKSLQAQCEILIPGFRTPTFDGKQARKFTVDTMCATRRKVLDSLYATADGQQLIDSVADSSGNLELLSLPCAKVTTIFNAAAGAKKLLNNRAATVDANRTPAATPPVKSNVPQSIAELNAAMNKHYSQA